jgi:hypothetical protein
MRDRRRVYRDHSAPVLFNECELVCEAQALFDNCRIDGASFL